MVGIYIDSVLVVPHRQLRKENKKLKEENEELDILKEKNEELALRVDHMEDVYLPYGLN